MRKVADTEIMQNLEVYSVPWLLEEVACCGLAEKATDLNIPTMRQGDHHGGPRVGGRKGALNL